MSGRPIKRTLRGSSLWWRPRVGGVRPHSLWGARQARGMCGGEGTAMSKPTRSH